MKEVIQESTKSTGVQFQSEGPPGCSWFECANGHRWGPKLALTKCEGCGTQVLLAMVMQCPVCNEPTERMEVTMHHIPNGGGVAKACLGEPSTWDVVKIGMERKTWEKVEGTKDANAERSN